MASDNEETIETPGVVEEPKEQAAEKPKPRKKPKMLIKGFEYMGKTMDLDEDQVAELLKIALRFMALRQDPGTLQLTTLQRKVRAAARGGDNGCEVLSSVAVQM